MRRSPFAFALVLTAAGQAGAEIHRDGEVAVGPPTHIHATRDGSLARLSVRFTARAVGPHEVDLQMEVPPGAAVIAAAVTADGATHPLALVAAVGSDTTLGAMRETAPAGTPRKWVAVMSSNAGSGLVSVALLAPHDTRLTFDLTLTLPTCYFEGARYAQVPPDWKFAFDPELRARPIPANLHEGCFTSETLDADGHDTASAYLALPANELAAAPSGTPRIGVAAARLKLTTTDIAQVELALAPKLTQVPADLATAFVVDGSRSMSPEQADAQRRVILAYARYAPASRVQVIAYAHTAYSVLPAWSLAQAALPRIDRELQHVGLKNGSDARAGLALAGTWLARLGPATKRVVLFTDELVPRALENVDAAELAALLPAGTLVHVVAIASSSDNGIVRTPTAYGGVADVTEGISVRGGLEDAAEPDAISSIEQLVRPVALERLSIDAPGWKLDTAGPDACPTTAPGDETFDQQLFEGRGCTWSLSGPALAGPVTVTGLLWGHRVSRIVRPDQTRATALARELQSAPPTAVTEDDRDALLAAAHAMNERWSFTGAWGGNGGYSDVIELAGYGTVSTCGIGCRSHDVGIGTMGHGTGVPSVQIPLDVQLRGALREACPAAAHNRVVVTVETTRQEIAGLDVTVAPLLAAPSETADVLAAKRACIEAALWEVPLALHDPPSHATVTVAL